MSIRIHHSPPIGRAVKNAVRQDQLIKAAQSMTVMQIGNRLATNPRELAQAVALLIKLEAARLGSDGTGSNDAGNT